MTRRRISWAQHRRYYQQSLLAGGLSADIAHRMSAGEINARERVSRAIGAAHGLNATLLRVFDGRGGMRVFLAGSRDGLTEEQAEAIEALNRKQAA
ncbi:MAG: hypothetical protein PGN16_13720 [Sphingomonas phyllosphaerae]|uniref:hypothetical protein n=1 Tax=Sphingomonas phyllosphaerae TaxID=257003 RepID=UPI002FFCB0D1